MILSAGARSSVIVARRYPKPEPPQANGSARSRNIFHNFRDPADENGMTHAIEIAQSLDAAQALSHYAAHRLATTPNKAGATLSDIVSLSSAAAIDSQINAANRPSETAGAGRHGSFGDRSPG